MRIRKKESIGHLRNNSSPQKIGPDQRASETSMLVKHNFPLRQSGQIIKPVKTATTSAQKVLKSEQLCDRLKQEFADLKSVLSKDCDEILNKIDDLLGTEITTFDKSKDYRMKETVEGLLELNKIDKLDHSELEWLWYNNSFDINTKI